MWQACFSKCLLFLLLAHPLLEVNFSQIAHAHTVTLISVVAEWRFSAQFHKKEKYCNFQAQQKGDNKNVMTHHTKKAISYFFEWMNGYRLKETVIPGERLISVTSHNF